MRIKNRKGVRIAASLLALCFFSFAQEEDKFLRLSIGNPALRDKVLNVVPGIIYSADSGKPVDFGRMIEDIASSRFIYIGESHDNLAMHNIQYQIIEALWAKDQNIALGLEMFPTESQEVLDKWSQGLLSKDEFLREVEWYIHWNMNFAYYEKILDLAKEKKIPVFALNIRREVINKIRMRGWKALSEEERTLVPQPDLSDEEHRLLIRTIFDSTELPHAMKGEGLDQAFEGLYRAQVAWDEVMASNAIQSAGKDRFRMIILAGSGHLYYNLGINKRVYEQNRLSYKTIIPVSTDPEAKSISVARNLGDYLWVVDGEERPAFPAVGLSFKKFDGLDNLVIDRKPFDGAAKSGDFEKGDLILSVDDNSFSDINELRIYLARFSWGDKVNFRILRGAEMKDVTLSFVWPPPEEKPVEEKKGEAKKTQTSSSPRIDRLALQIQLLLADAEGEVGVAVKHIESGEEIFVAAHHQFPMASVFKVPILVEVLTQVKEGRVFLRRGNRYPKEGPASGDRDDLFSHCSRDQAFCEEPHQPDDYLR